MEYISMDKVRQDISYTKPLPGKGETVDATEFRARIDALFEAVADGSADHCRIRASKLVDTLCETATEHDWFLRECAIDRSASLLSTLYFRGIK